MTTPIIAEAPFYRQDGSAVVYSGIPAALIIALTQLQEEGPAIPQTLDGRVFVQRVVDRDGVVLLEIYGVNLPAGRIRFTFTADHGAGLLPVSGVAALDLVHQVGELTLDGFSPFLQAPFGIRRLKVSAGATALKLQPGEDVIIIRYEGAPGPDLLQTLVAAGVLTADATVEDLVVLLQAQAAAISTEAIELIVAARQSALTAIADREQLVVDPETGSIAAATQVGLEAIADAVLNEDTGALAVIDQGEADALQAIDLRKVQATDAVAAREDLAIRAGDGAIPVREAQAIDAIAVRQGQATDAVGIREASALETVGNTETGVVLAIDAARDAATATLAAQGTAIVDNVIAAAATANSLATSVAAGLAAHPTLGAIWCVAGAIGSGVVYYVYETVAGPAASLRGTAPDLASVLALLTADVRLDALEGRFATRTFVGVPEPAAGTSAGNNTDIMMWKAPYDGWIEGIVGRGMGGGGTWPMRLLKQTTIWEQVGVDIQLTTPDGPFTFSPGVGYAPIFVPAGCFVAFYPNGKVATLASTAPYTPFERHVGNFSTGAFGTVTNNSGLQIGFSFVRAGGSVAARQDGAIGVTGERIVLGATQRSTPSLLSNLGTNLASVTAYSVVAIPPGGRVVGITPFAGQAGWMTWLGVSRVPAARHQQDRNRQFPHKLVAGLCPRISPDDATFPSDWVFPDGGWLFALCVAGAAGQAGQLTYTATNSPAGETVAGAYLPDGTFTVIAAAGLVTPTWAASNRLFSVQVEVELAVSGRRVLLQPDRVILNETYAGAAIPLDMKSAGTWTYPGGSAVSGGSTGMASYQEAKYGSALDMRVEELDFRLADASSTAYLRMRPIAGNYGSSMSVDPITNTLTRHVGSTAGTSTVPAAYGGAGGTVVNPFPNSGALAPGKVYRGFFLTDGRKYTQGLYTSDTGEVSQLVQDLTPAQIPPLNTPPSSSLDFTGQNQGALNASRLAGNIEIVGARMRIPNRSHATVWGIGHSIFKASRCAYQDGWALQMRAAMARYGKNLLLNANDGWNSNSMHIALKLMLAMGLDLPQHVIMGGPANETNVNVWKAQLDADRYLLLDYGIKPWRMLDAPISTVYPTTPLILECNQYARDTAWNVIPGDVLLSTNQNPLLGRIEGYYYAAGDAHPIKAGHDVLFNQGIMTYGREMVQ